MSVILLGEYRNQNEGRNYPFADDLSLTDTDGVPLPTDFLVDAFIYPIGTTGGVYLSSIDSPNNRIYFADTVSGTVLGHATYIPGQDYAYVFEEQGAVRLTIGGGHYERQIGTIVFGSGVNALFSGAALRTFDATATALCPTAYANVVQPGVTGLIDSLNQLTVGDLTVNGSAGVTTRTYVDPDGKRVLELNVVGVPPPYGDDCGTPPPITSLCVQRFAGSALAVSNYAVNTLALSAFNNCLSDICAAQKARVLPDATGKLPNSGEDVCATPSPTPVPFPPGVDEDPICLTPADGQSLHIVTPSTVDCTNPVLVRSVTPVGNVVKARLPPNFRISNISDVQSVTEKFANAPFDCQALEIGFKGLAPSQGKRPVSTAKVL